MTSSMFRGASTLRARSLVTALACWIATLVWLAASATAATVTVVSSGGFAAALRALAPGFERSTGDTLVLQWGPSMGDTHDAVPQRLARGEPIDVVIMVGYALDGLARQGKLAGNSRVDLARSDIGVVVKQGTSPPDIGTADAVRRALLAAPSIAYSDSASGVYIQNEMFAALGIADAVRGKARMIPAEPVGAVVARGEAAIGFQQISELKPIAGITLVGPLPPPLQRSTVFAAAVVADARQPDAARALLRYLSAPEAAGAIRDSGMQPIADAR